jgi:hypothetical protein
MGYAIWSHEYLHEATDNACIFVNEYEWTRLHEIYPTAKRLFAKIVSGDKILHCGLGQPVRSSTTAESVFLPNWAIAYLNIYEMGSIYEVEWISEEYFPEAISIILRPHDSAFYSVDVKGELEAALTQYGVLHSGTSIPITIKALGDYTIKFDVISLEPANIVLMQGDEVAIMFEHAADLPAPLVYRPIVNRASDDTSILPPVIPIVNDGGYTLGGTQRPNLPDGRKWNHWRNVISNARV